MVTKKTSAVGALKQASKKPAAAPVRVAEPIVEPAGLGKVTPEEAERLKSLNQLLTLKRLEMATRVEEFFFSMDQVASVRTSRAQFLQDLADAHGVDVSKPWSISPDDLSIRYPDQA